VFCTREGRKVYMFRKNYREQSARKKRKQRTKKQERVGDGFEQMRKFMDSEFESLKNDLFDEVICIVSSFFFFFE
jgi:hypothetical protein